MKWFVVVLVTGFLAFMAADRQVSACTNFIVTRGASKDGSVMITYTCDGEFHPRLRCTPAGDHGPDEYIEIKDWSGNVLGKVKQVPHTYAVLCRMNEHQVVIGETTFDGRKELQNPDAVLHYWWLMTLALQRAETAREAILVMADLVGEYGYASTGESFSIADSKEAWIMEIIGSGPGGSGANWVALRVPDGYICCHANMSRISEFPLDDKKNCIYSENVIPFAIEKGYYDPDSGRPFSFRDAYCPPMPQTLRYTATRVWSIFRRCVPSKDFSHDYHRAVEGAESYPLWIKPDEKLSLNDVFDIMRDHYEGTDYDMTVGVDAGPYGSPNRWRPMIWEIDGIEYSWERPISTQQTGFSFVSQSRSNLPDPIGGVLWYGVDDTYTTCYVPLYCGMNEVPESYARGNLRKFSWDSAWWVFNFVANYANLKYSYMIKDIQEVQSQLEGDLIATQPAVEKAAIELYKEDPEFLTRYLNDYSVSRAEQVVKRWRGLGEHLITRYNDGYVQDENGRSQEVGYPEPWLREVLGSRPEQFKLKRWEDDTLQTELPY
ncbi:MAG: C69 family dipeptidase [Candidatus Krumholzibacteria bacterium]|nr:C69 family dipeptidase [Candidatus Krumholzibacteria bacterium]